MSIASALIIQDNLHLVTFLEPGEVVAMVNKKTRVTDHLLYDAEYRIIVSGEAVTAAERKDMIYQLLTELFTACANTYNFYYSNADELVQRYHEFLEKPEIKIQWMHFSSEEQNKIISRHVTMLSLPPNLQSTLLQLFNIIKPIVTAGKRDNEPYYSVNDDCLAMVKRLLVNVR